MIKNRYAQLFVRAAILIVMLIGAVLSFRNNNTWFIFYTNLSNYLCLLVVLAELVMLIIAMGKGKTNGNEDVHPTIKFSTLIIITVTFLVYNFILSSPTADGYWSNLSNVLMHFVNPILFWLDWILFAKHRNTRWFYPLLELILPLIYVAYILICNVAFPSTFFYPYFFLNVAELGYGGVALWVLGLVAVFLVLGYLIYIIDNIKNWHEKRLDKKNAKLN